MTRILLVDDEPSMSRLVGMCLGDLVDEVKQVASSAEAVESARRESPAVLMLDIALGKEDGLKVIPRLRREPSLAHVPIVVFSVHDSRAQEAFASGEVAGFVKKPFKTHELVELIEPLLVGNPSGDQ